MKLSIGSLLSMIAFAVVACTTQPHATEAQYTCPMHPQIIRDKQGSCPICQMALVLKNGAHGKIEMTGSLRDLLRSPGKAVVSHIGTVRPEHRAICDSVKLTGVIVSDDRRSIAVSMRVSGRIEHVMMHSALQAVHKGEKILSAYSPELVAAQKELVYLIKSDPSNIDLISSASNKLLLSGMTQQQIDQVKSTGVVLTNVDMISPADGYIEPSPGSELAHEGMYVEKGQILFVITSAKAFRASLDGDQNLSGVVKPGDSVRVKLDDGYFINTTINTVQQFLDPSSPFVKMRADLPGSHPLRPGQLVTATLHLCGRSGWWIPIASKLNLGSRDIVFVKSDNVFVPRVVRLGERLGSWVEIKEGLGPADQIAATPNFLVDADGQIQTGDTNEN